MYENSSHHFCKISFFFKWNMLGEGSQSSVTKIKSSEYETCTHFVDIKGLKNALNLTLMARCEIVQFPLIFNKGEQ